MNKNYYTLDEAASFLTERLNKKITPDAVLRFAASRESALDLCIYFHGGLEFQQENTECGGLSPSFCITDDFRGYLKIPVDAIHPGKDNFSPFQYARVIEEVSNGLFTDPSAEKVLFPTLYAKRIKPMNSSSTIPFHPQDETTLTILLEPLAQEPVPIPFVANRKESLISEKSLFDFLENNKNTGQSDPQAILVERETTIVSTYEPQRAIGKLVVKTAEEIEQSTGRRAIAKDVMEKLYTWADEGKYPDILLRSEKKHRRVVWLTGKYGDALYTTEACEKTLREWNKGRTKTTPN